MSATTNTTSPPKTGKTLVEAKTHNSPEARARRDKFREEFKRHGQCLDTLRKWMDQLIQIEDDENPAK